MMAVTISLSWRESARPRRKLRSIFSSSTGSRRRWASELNPVPNSSIEMVAPSLLSRLRSRRMGSSSVHRLFSVISTTNRPGSTPALSAARLSVSARPPGPNWRGDTFTAMRGAGRPSSASQRESCSAACRIIHAPIGTMRPDSSAMDRNRAGVTGPCPGRSQAGSVSIPTTVPVTRSTCGWNCRSSSPRDRAWRSARCRSRRRSAWVRISAVNACTWARPWAFARYIAPSAFCSRSSGDTWESLVCTSPMLMLAVTSPDPGSVNSMLNAFTTRSASSRASSEATSGHRTTNSSPPSLATVSQ